MSNISTPMNEQSAFDRTVLAARNIIAPHPTITDPSRRRRTQILNVFAILLTLTLAAGFALSFNQLANFRFAPLATVAAYILGKSKYPRVGVTLFSAAALSSAYLLLYNGLAASYIFTVITFTSISLVIVHMLVTPRTFAAFAAAAVLAAYFAPSYSKTFILTSDIAPVTGILLALSILLYAASAIHANIEYTYQSGIAQKEAEILTEQTKFEAATREHDKTVEASKQEIQNSIDRLKAVSDISQEITANINRPLQDLLAHITQVISQRLGYYHVGVFLLDKKRQYAELRAANSEGGERMLRRRHQLKVGGTGIVGYAAQSGFPRIALSTGSDAVYFNNPDLPETQSEMALPLKIGSQVIGILDVQSTQPSAFSDEDVNAFTALANQIAFAIETFKAGEDLRSLTGSENAKPEDKARATKQAYIYLADGTITSSQGISSPILERSINLGQTVSLPASSKNALPVLAVPVKVRESVVGYIHIEAGEQSRKWSDNEIALVEAISERAALALENARLFEETERRAEQERTIVQVTSRIGESNSFERVLQTTIQEIGRTLGAKRAFIQMETPAVAADNESNTA